MVQHEATLRKFLTRIISGGEQPDDSRSPFSGYLSGRAPEDLLTEELKAAELTSIVLTGEERDIYYDVFAKLRADTTTDHLSDGELKDRLWYLVCEVVINTKDYRDGARLKTRIREFLSDLCRPIEEYEVMFNVLHLDVGDAPIEFWGCRIAKLSREDLLTWGFDPEKDERVLRNFENQSLLTISEHGNSRKYVVERARRRAHIKLKALQTALRGHNFVANEQLLFELGEFDVTRKPKEPNRVSWGWTRKWGPWGLTIGDSFRPLIEEANERLRLAESLTPKLREVVDRAVYWLGRSIDEPEPDQKVVALCAAMEALLTQRSDVRKGEAIAYRMVLLEAILGNSFLHPSQVVWIYTLRSQVVHGSGIDVATKAEYRTLLFTARKTLHNFITFISQRGIKKQSDLIRTLETSGEAAQMLEWIAKFDDTHSKEISTALQQATEMKPAQPPGPQD